MLVNGYRTETLSASDRGLQYGDGLFETMAVVGGQPTLWDRHLSRLYAGCRRLGIPLPSEPVLAREAEALCAGAGSAVLKLIVTRGAGGRGYAPPRRAEPTRLLSLHAYPGYPARFWHAGVVVRVCQQRLGNQPSLAGLKHLNRLEQVLARSEWDDPDIAEGVMLSQNDQVIEGTMTNIFAISAGVAVTPRIDEAGVAGVMRGLVMEMLQESGVQVREQAFGLSVLESADEVFLTNSVIGIWPVRALGGKAVGRAARARGLFERLVAEGLVPAQGEGS